MIFWYQRKEHAGITAQYSTFAAKKQGEGGLPKIGNKNDAYFLSNCFDIFRGNRYNKRERKNGQKGEANMEGPQYVFLYLLSKTDISNQTK